MPHRLVVLGFGFTNGSFCLNRGGVMEYNGKNRRVCEAANNCPDADTAADRAVHKVFAILGVDVDNPESVAEFQDSLRFSKKLMRLADHGILAFIAVAAAAIAAALWAGIVSKISGGH